MPDNAPHHVYAVILAGGSGTRFWPLSRELSPKQMLSVFGETSLICATIERARAIVGEDGPAIEIVVGATLLDELRNHLLSQSRLAGVKLDYLVEPLARNTAPALALAAACIEARDPQAIVMMLPSDQLVDNGPAWRATMRAAVEAAATDEALVTIGLKPTRPETGYGYIKAQSAADGALARKVEAFVEKPDVATAQRYLDAGNYYWNSGMLVARARVILDELVAAFDNGVAAAAGNARMVEVARRIAAVPASERLSPANYQLFETLPNVSFDNAALELSTHVVVVPAAMAWSDVGSLLSLEDLETPDCAGNRVIGTGVTVDSRDTLVYSPERLVATLGTENLLVVDTSDATLVAPRDRAQDVRLVVDALARQGAPELREPKVSARPWGTWTIVKEGAGFKVKEIVVTPGSRLSLQSHERRSEHWVVVEGTAIVTQGDEEIRVETGQSVYNPIGMKHRLENRGEGDLHIIEIQVGDYLGEDDITRYTDDFQRV